MVVRPAALPQGPDGLVRPAGADRADLPGAHGRPDLALRPVVPGPALGPPAAVGEAPARDRRPGSGRALAGDLRLAGVAPGRADLDRRRAARRRHDRPDR